MKYAECRKHGHDWQPTDDDTVMVCSHCQTQRTENSFGRSYQFPPGYVAEDILATYNNCETLEHNWRHVRVTKDGDVIRQLLTCDRCLAKMIREMSTATGELINETITPPGAVKT